MSAGTKVADKPRGSARDRLLAAANELFYNEGIHTVGIDRIIEQAGVAKASLYNTFGSKDELVEAYLRSRHARNTDRITQALQRYRTPRTRLLGVFEAQEEIFADPGYRGCAFANATAEGDDGGAARAAAEYRLWVRALFTELAQQADAPDPELLARQLHMLFDGAVASARQDRDGTAARTARATAAIVLDAALGESDTASGRSPRSHG